MAATRDLCWEDKTMKGERTAKGRVATRPFGRVLANRGILPGESLSWTIFLEKLPKDSSPHHPVCGIQQKVKITRSCGKRGQVQFTTNEIVQQFEFGIRLEFSVTRRNSDIFIFSLQVDERIIISNEEKTARGGEAPLYPFCEIPCGWSATISDNSIAPQIKPAKK